MSHLHLQCETTGLVLDVRKHLYERSLLCPMLLIIVGVEHYFFNLLKSSCSHSSKITLRVLPVPPYNQVARSFWNMLGVINVNVYNPMCSKKRVCRWTFYFNASAQHCQVQEFLSISFLLHHSRSTRAFLCRPVTKVHSTLRWMNPRILGV